MPIDLERPELRKRIRGYDPTAVDRLIHGAAKTLQELLFENSALREELERLRADSDRAKLQEETLKDVLVLAQRAADETRATAQKQAEAVVEEARQAAMSERMATQQKLSETRWEIERLRLERSRYAEEFRALLERHQRELSQMVPLTIVEGEASSA
ncbi:DivIVA domain-containing protein [Fimbriimonas ginsengisoli]|nr:DivIVA domain-containing protein [Fimbriimonas ginsengisoli]